MNIFINFIFMHNLLFGTAGIPISTEKRNTLEGIRHVKRLGLDAMELEFVHSVNIRKENAPAVKDAARENGIVLTCHGQYYMNLNSTSVKIAETKKRILNAARIAWLCGAWSLCFHAAYYMKKNPNEVYEIVKKHLKDISKTLENEGNKIWLRPELTGKASQFGTLEELVKLSSEIERVLPCVDFSHSHARTGKYNTYEEFCGMLSAIENIGSNVLQNMHMHLSGIEYGNKGEKRHLELKESDMNYKDLMKALKDFKVRGVIISESPSIEKDAMLIKKFYESL